MQRSRPFELVHFSRIPEDLPIRPYEHIFIEMLHLSAMRLVPSILLLVSVLISAGNVLYAQDDTRWQLTDRNGILLDLTTLPSSELPISENIEMSGKRVSAILYYDIDTNRLVRVRRNVIYPQLRTFVKTTEPAWKKYRAYLQSTIEDDALPTITVGDEQLGLNGVDSIEIDGTLTLYHSPQRGIIMKRTFIAANTEGALKEYIELKNTHANPLKIGVGYSERVSTLQGHTGIFEISHLSHIHNQEGNTKPHDFYTLSKGESIELIMTYRAQHLDTTAYPKKIRENSKKKRESYLNEIRNRLVLSTPNPIINQLFEFSKIRVSESIFESNMGLIHSPGGGNYYVGTWANDQVEYSGPFFPYLGYPTGNEAAYNTYKKFLSAIPKDSNDHLPYAFEVNGNFVMDHLDRGDAAMVAYGTSHYLLARGSMAQAEELWPLIEWSLAYCKRMQNDAGAVKSESDEMEGRIPTGDANLSTSSLYYGGLKYASYLAKTLGKNKLAARYKSDAAEMHQVINTYFGATINGLETYQYFEGNEYLRHWICLPLVMGIHERKSGTLDALFNKLWTDNGILVELNPDNPQTVFWDRATLYALRGAFKAGEVDLATQKLIQFSNQRLLGNHVPYVVEAYPENNMKHLSAESALYCRVITEGLLGIEPTSFSTFNLRPKLPTDWDTYSLSHLAIGKADLSIDVRRIGKKIQVTVMNGDQLLKEIKISEGETIEIKALP